MAKARQHTIRDDRDLPIQVDTAIIDRYAEQIGVYGIAVYVALARFAKRENTTILAYQTIADVLGVARSTVQNTIKKLIDAGLIHSEQQTDDAGNPIASNRYTLLPIRHSKADHEDGGYRETVGGVPPNGTPYRETVGGVPPNGHIKMDSTIRTHDLHVGVGVGRTREFLIDRGMSAADEFAHLSYEAARADYEARSADGQTNAQIVRAWRQKPPVEGQPYEPRRSTNGRATASDQSRRPGGKHGPTGGSDIHDPGWRERLIAKAEAGEL